MTNKNIFSRDRSATRLQKRISKAQRRKQKRNRQRRSFQFETLEDRIVLAAVTPDVPVSEVANQVAGIHEIFSADTTEEDLVNYYTALGANGDPHSEPFQFSDGNRWTTTATDGGGLVQGDATTITWSFIQDGTFIPSFGRGNGAVSDLISFLDVNLGAGVGPAEDLEMRPWFSLFEDTFDRWGELTGVSYVYEVGPVDLIAGDDGAAFVSNDGLLGARGDVRIGGRFVDGEVGSNVLAFNFFPNTGDMVIDTGNISFYSAGGVGFTNVVSHEHGHGLGISHECPIQQNTLMEPFISTAFDGPQFDDILAGHRGYGDFNESGSGNDSTGTATTLGAIVTAATVTVGADATPDEVVLPTETDFVSIDDNSDTDLYSFSVDPSVLIQLTLTPLGPTYLSGPQNFDGSCSAGTLFDSSAQNDLTLELLDSGGVTLATANVSGLGGSEFIALPSGAVGGTFFARVTGADNTAQLYQLDVNPIDFNVAGPVDFGDAPDSYGTLLASGARHTVMGARLGDTIDGETDAQSPLDGTGDDLINTGTPDDEDGVTVSGVPLDQVVFVEGTGAVTVTVDVQNVGGSNDVQVWYDSDFSGTFEDPAELIHTESGIAADGTFTFDFTPTSVGDSYMRFRLSSAGGLAPDTGLAADGEIEDYRVSVIPLPPALVSWVPQGPAPIENGQVEEINPIDAVPNNEVAGAVNTLIAHPTDPNILWIGTVNGGIWRTDDALSVDPTWYPQTDNLPTLSIAELAIDPSNPNILVAGLGNYSSFGVSDTIGGILVTDDGGVSWTNPGSIGLGTIEQISGIVVQGTTIVLTSKGSSGGIFRSTDGGATFAPISDADFVSGVQSPGSTDGTHFFNLIADGSDGSGQRLYASAESMGIYRSDDFGATWVKITGPAINALMDEMLTDSRNSNTQLGTALLNGRLYTTIILNGELEGVFVTPNPTADTPTWFRQELPVLPVGGDRFDVEFAFDTSPIVITATAHGLTTGDRVIVSHVEGNTAANGDFRVTVLNANQFSLDGSIGNGFGVGTGTVTPIPELEIATVSDGPGPITVTTVPPHGLSDGDRVVIDGVTGNTAANGNFRVAVIDANTFTLEFSEGTGAYISGGIVTAVFGVDPEGETTGPTNELYGSILVDNVNPDIAYVGGLGQGGVFPNVIGADGPSGNLHRLHTYVAPDFDDIEIPSPQWDHLTHNAGTGLDRIGGTRPNDFAGTNEGSAPGTGSRAMTQDANGNVIEVDDSGIYRRTSPRNNAGGWFSLLGNLQITEQHDVAYDSRSNVILSGNNGSGTTFQTSPGSLTWDTLASSNGGDVAIDDSAANSLRYSSGEFLTSFIRSSWSAGNAPTSTPTVIDTSFITGDAQPVTPIALNRVDPTRMIIGGVTTVYESTNNVAIDAAPAFAGVLDSSGANTNAMFYGHQSNSDLIVVGSGSTVWHRTGVVGTSMTATAPIPGAGTIRDVFVDPSVATTYYAVDSDSVFQSMDAGATWTDITGNLTVLGGDFQQLEYIEGVPNDALIVATDNGVFFAGSNDFTKWRELGAGLPSGLAYDLDYDADDDVLVVGTFGRGAFLLADASAVVNATTLDFGDAPDTYGTLLASDGARHIAGGPLLGVAVDTEGDAEVPQDGTGDDVNPGTPNDEDGVILPAVITQGLVATFTVNVTNGPAKLNAFIDFDKDGVFEADQGEQVATDLAVNSGPNALDILIPPTAALGHTFARFRISTAGGDSATGLAFDGEVEDYAMTIYPVVQEVYINEVNFAPPGIDPSDEYIELRGVPNAVLADGTYLVAIEGDNPNPVPANYRGGDVRAIFDLSGLEMGSEGYFVFLQDGNGYTVDPGAHFLEGTLGGFRGIPGYSADGNAANLPSASVSFLLIEAPQAPRLFDRIDSDENGVGDGAVFATWNLLDTIGITDGGATDTAYGPIAYAANNVGITQAGAVKVNTTAITVGYVGRTGDTTGSAATDWVGSRIVGVMPNFNLGIGTTFAAALNGARLDHVGSTNFPPPERGDMYAGVQGTPNAQGVLPGNAGRLLTVDQVSAIGFLVFDPITPGGITGLDFLDQRLFASTVDTAAASPDPSLLVELDPNTGALINTIGGITDSGTSALLLIEDLAFHPDTGVLYALDRTGTDGSGSLYSIDIATGLATNLGATPLVGMQQNGGLAFDADGNLYMTTLGTDSDFKEISLTGSQISSVDLAIDNLNGLGGRVDGLDFRFYASRAGSEQVFNFLLSDPATINAPGTTQMGEPGDLAIRPFPPELDYGDAPDSYSTTLLSDGPSHGLTGPTLGTERDGEFDAQLPLDGTGDDVTDTGSVDDEDGVTVGGTSLDGVVLTAGVASTIDIEVAGGGAGTHLKMWLDFDRDGTFDDPGELIYSATDVATGTETFSFTPPGGSIGTTYARVRVTTDGSLNGVTDGLTPTSVKADGEVEDYEVTIVSPGFDTPILNFDGIDQFDVGILNPPDTVGDVGPNHFVQMTNDSDGSHVRIFDKFGNELDDFDLRILGGPLTFARRGDPIVLYDNLADRWVLSEFAPDFQRLIVYVSTGPTPTSNAADWYVYDFGAPNFPDYPKLSVWPDAYYVTTNEFNGIGNSEPAVYALDRTNMLLGLAARPQQRFVAAPLAGFGFQALTPADLDGQAPPVGSAAYFARHRDDEAHNPGTNDPNRDFIEIFEFNVDFNNQANSSFNLIASIAVAEFDSDLNGLLAFDAFPQPNGPDLDPLREVLMWRLQYRNFGTHETLVGNYVSDFNGEDGGGIRWFEIRKTAVTPWSLYQQGEVSIGDATRWMGAIAMDGDGNIALGYNIVKDATAAVDDIAPGIRYVGRRAGDPLGSMTTFETTLIDPPAGSGNPSNRWGDYSSMSIDPSDDKTFWFTGEYAGPGPFGSWKTRIGAFAFGTPGVSIVETLGDIALVEEGETFSTYKVQLTEPISPGESVTVTATSDGQTSLSLNNVDFMGSVDIVLTDMTPRTVIVKAIDDGGFEGDHVGIVTNTISASTAAEYPASTNLLNVTARFRDNDIMPPTADTLIGVDFDDFFGFSPVNWNGVYGPTASGTPITDLIDEAGNTTPIDLRIVTTENTGFFTPDPGFPTPTNATPTHDQSLAGIDGAFFAGTGDQFTFVFEDLDPLTDYDVFVFGLASTAGTNDVEIEGDGAAITSFSQVRAANQLFVNGSPDLGLSSARPLDDFATVVTSDGSGEITITVTNTTFDTFGVAGLAIRPAAVPPTVPVDFGDAPDPSAGTGPGNYNTRFADGGPSHVVTAGIMIGATIDAETDASTPLDGTGDDVTGSPDEDGVVDTGDLALTEGVAPMVDVMVTTPGGATLYGWIDYDGDGMFEASEMAMTTPAATGTVTLVFPVVPVGSVATSFARFRLSTDGAAASPTGAASDGEVEDYAVTIADVVVPPPGGGPPASVNGIKYLDLAPFGSREDPGTEVGLPGFYIYVDLDEDGEADFNEPAAITSADGSFSILMVDFLGTALPSGTYLVREVPVAGFTQTDPAGALPETVVYTAGTAVTGLEFGNKVTPLLASGGIDGPGATAIVNEDLTELVAEAQARWIASGLTPDQIDIVKLVEFSLGDLDPGYLARRNGKESVIIDSTGAGYGWYVDKTPAEDSEFTAYTGGTQYVAEAGSFALGKMDLLTAIMHEMGHQLELEHLGDDVLMSDQLPISTRRLLQNPAVGVPTIDGTSTEDEVLTANTSGISDADGLGAFSFQWLRDGVVITNATSSTLTLGDDDVGTKISVQVSYTDLQGTAESITSAQTATVANVNDAPVGVPAIDGTATEDEVLTASTSGITDADGLGAFSYQWLRDGAVIDNATSSTLTLGHDDVGTKISVQVSYTDGQDTAEGPLTSVETATVASLIGETGSVSISQADANTWTTVNLDHTYNNAVVIASPVSYSESEQSTVRVRNVTSNSFEIQIDEWDDLDGGHIAETIHYLVMEAGVHTLEDGTKITAGARQLDHNWVSVSLDGLGATPVVLSQLQTYRDSSAAVTRQRNVSASAFEMRLQEEEGNDGIHAVETVGYLAIEAGTGASHEAGVTGDSVTDTWSSVSFANSYPSPVFLAAMQSFDGSDPATLRYQALIDGSVQVKIEEEQSSDTEVAHTTENVGYVVFGSSSNELYAIASTPVVVSPEIGEAGQVTFSQANASSWQTVALNGTYVNPVVIASPASYNGADPSTVRVRNVTSSSFEIQIDEWDYRDGGHIAETISYVVLEAGVHTLEDGTKITAGTQQLDHNWSAVNLTGFASAPVVVSQVQTYNGPSAVDTRQKNISASGFDVRVQEEEGNDVIHAVETVGYLAIEARTGASHEAAVTGDSVTNSWSSVSFANSYTSPVFLASMQTYDGPDPATLRYRALSDGSVQVKIEEEQSADTEVAHTTENVGWIAFNSGTISSGAAPLMAAGDQPAFASTQVLTTADIDPLLDDAIAAWAAVGVSDSQLGRLAGLQVGIADLSGARLGEQIGNTITLDVNAAGYGWHTSADTPVADRMDLLTVIYHEMGHAIGLEHGADGDVMDDLLEIGVRRLPSAEDLDSLFASDLALDEVLV